MAVVACCCPFMACGTALGAMFWYFLFLFEVNAIENNSGWVSVSEVFFVSLPFLRWPSVLMMRT